MKLAVLALALLASSCPIKITLPPVVPSPEPSPSAGPDPVPSPSPTAGPVPSPTPVPTPTPQPSPSVPVPSPSPWCMSAPDCVKPAGCVSCAAYMADAIRSGELIREGDLVYNIGNAGKEYFDPLTCFTVWPDGSLRNKRLIKDGTICPACPQSVPIPCPSPSPTPSPSSDRYCTLEPGARNWPLMPGSDKLKSEGGVCPSCWGDNPGMIVSRCGVKHRATQSRNGGDGRRYIFDVTCHSDAPRCPHRPDQRSCDVLWACQPDEPAMYQTGPGFDLARVDRVSHNPYLGQIHISDPAENGWYTINACPPGVRPDGPDGEARCGSLYLYVGTDGELK